MGRDRRTRRDGRPLSHPLSHPDTHHLKAYLEAADHAEIYAPLGCTPVRWAASNGTAWDGVDREFFPEGPDGRLTSLLPVNIGHPDGEDSWRERQARLPAGEALRRA
ncbi:hypothetical protein AB0H92_08055 [Streptomyces phaeochromogenes]|uniref:hypothetical protein n=1 Tax=Streptomyces phaeochromogenes TaxID=1923 RepID=UPI0033E0FB4D